MIDTLPRKPPQSTAPSQRYHPSSVRKKATTSHNPTRRGVSEPEADSWAALSFSNNNHQDNRSGRVRPRQSSSATTPNKMLVKTASTKTMIPAAEAMGVMSTSANGSSSVESEVFLRNPKTGGFDYTPAVQDYQQHLKKVDHDPLRSFYPHRNQQDDASTLNDSTVYTSYSRKPLLPKQQQPPAQAQEQARARAKPNINSNRHQTKATKKNPLSLLSPRSKTSFQRYFQTKATKTPNATSSTPPAARVTPVTPSPSSSNVKKGGILKQLRCSMTNHSSSPLLVKSNMDANDKNNHTTPVKEERPKYIHPQVEPAATTSARQVLMDRKIMSSRSKRQGDGRKSDNKITTSAMATPPRSGRSPPKRAPYAPSSSSSTSTSYCDHHSLMDKYADDDDDDDEEDASYLPKHKNNPSSPASIASSCLDFSFSTVGPQTKASKTDDSMSWTFEAVSPVTLCGGRTSKDVLRDDALSVEISAFGLMTAHNNDQSSSGFDADMENTTVLTTSLLDQTTGGGNEVDSLPSTLDVAIVHPTSDGASLSLNSAGALLLTEAGLKRHNDKKLQEDHIPPFQLRQQNGAGKLEKEVLKQKVERLQAKELQKQADASLEEERAARKRRLRKEHSNNNNNNSPPVVQKNDSNNSDDGVSGEEERGAAAATTRESLTTPTKRNSPPRAVRFNMTPTSMSPQTSTGPSPVAMAATATAGGDATNNNKKASSAWYKRVFKKKPDPEELKQQWKERERQRVQLAQLEKKEEERLERERIESLRRAYLEKQRKREAAAVSATSARKDEPFLVENDDGASSPLSVVIDVDDLPPSPRHKVIIDVDSVHASSPNTSVEVDVDDLIDEDGNFFISSIPLEDYLVSNSNRHEPQHYHRKDDDKDTVSSSTTPPFLGDLGSAAGTSTSQMSLGPCCVCHERERTHIAMPCMHFAFCGDCVESRTVCPMCTTENVIFSRVNTE